MAEIGGIPRHNLLNDWDSYSRDWSHVRVLNHVEKSAESHRKDVWRKIQSGNKGKERLYE